jgi:hypothetical protein
VHAANCTRNQLNGRVLWAALSQTFPLRHRWQPDLAGVADAVHLSFTPTPPKSPVRLWLDRNNIVACASDHLTMQLMPR